MLGAVVAGRDALVKEAGLNAGLPVSAFSPSANETALLEQSKTFSPEHFAADPDIRSLAQTLLFGLKGAAAYADHAAVLGVEDAALYEAFYKGLAFGFDGGATLLDEWVAAVLECGRTNLEGHGIAGRGEHRRLRPSGTHPRFPRPARRQGHPGHGS